uniref:Solute carrier family 23 member 1-like n=1 Tax=Scophthalmus maximus TaxID=52904 RepID=A0A8D3C7U8_SCOMX
MGEQVDGQPSEKATKTSGSSSEVEGGRNRPTYCVTDVPPWYLCIFLAMQNYLTAFGGIISIPLILSEGLCLQHDSLTQGRLINTIFFVSGLCTLMQVTFGIRSEELANFCCPALRQRKNVDVNANDPCYHVPFQLQGSIMVASLLQILVGFSGLISFLMRFIGPLTTAPIVSLIGLSLYDSAGSRAGSHWGISVMTTALIILFSQYLRLIPIPVPAYSKTKKLHTSKFFIFQIIPILLGIVVSWLVCYILTIYDVLPSDPAQYGHLARTDVKGNVVGEASWFTFPYPGQWGQPTVSLVGVFGLMAGIICSMVESVGDYPTCARLSGAPPPPKHAISRGIGVEGLGSLLAGAFGTGNGTTSFSENVAALGITKVGSRTVILVSGFFMILLGMLGKIGAVFTTIPTPVIGGMLMVMFGVIAAAGISNLQSTDMNSSRNIFVFGFSIFSALIIPNWFMKNPDFIDTGVKEVDQVLHILLTTHIFVGGLLGFFLDNTVPGTKRERGLPDLDKVLLEDCGSTLGSDEVYDLPFGITSCLASQSWVRYIPVCPWKGHKSQSEDNTVSQNQGDQHSTEVTEEFAL